jgi:small subunit ribosomal protein S21
MIIIKVGKNENIDRALKRFKRKFRNTQIIKKLKQHQHFIKKSEKRRHEIQQATYKQKKFRDEE